MENSKDEPVLEERKEICDEIDEFIRKTEIRLKETCSSLGWDYSNTIKQKESYIICPFNKGHRVPEQSIEKHLESCEWNTLGYTKECKSLPESATTLESSSTIKFDIELQYRILQDAKLKCQELNIGQDERLIPQTSDRLASDFTRDERLAMYEYVIANTKAPDIGQDIQDLNKPEDHESISANMIELLAQERNLKRRRARYRGVHTNKKTHTEILREVVQQQMEMYKEYLSENYGISIPEIEEGLKPINQSNNHKNDERLLGRNSESSSTNFDEKHSKSNHTFKSKNEKKITEKVSAQSTKHFWDSNERRDKSSSKEQSLQNSSRKSDQHARDKKYSHNSHDKNCDKREYEKRDSKPSDLHNRKRDRSRSKEKRSDEKKSKHRSREHKEHKKDHKRKRSRSRSSHKKHKTSKRKHHRQRSRSCS